MAGTLWSESSEQHAAACLRSALWRLRRACPAPVVESSRTHLSVSAGVAVDIRTQVALARRLLVVPDETADADVAVLEGDLLPDWYDQWVVGERDRLRGLRLHALETLAEVQLGRGRFRQAAETAFLAVAADPLRESAQRILIRAYLAEGNLTDATRQYERYRVLVRDELGVEPSKDLRALVAHGGHSAAGSEVTQA